MRLIDIDAFKEKFRKEHEYAFNPAEARAVRHVLGELEDAPTAYDVEKVAEELEEFANLAEDRWVNGTSTHAYQEHKCWVKAIEIVREGGVE